MAGRSGALVERKRLQNDKNEDRKLSAETAVVTDGGASDQMGTRKCEMSELQWIYPRPFPLRSATHTAEQKRGGAGSKT